MRTIELSQVVALVPLLQPGSEPLFVTQDGETLAAIVPANTEDAEEFLLSINPNFQAILQRSQQRLESERAVTSADVRRQLGLLPTGSEE